METIAAVTKERKLKRKRVGNADTMASFYRTFSSGGRMKILLSLEGSDEMTMDDLSTALNVVPPNIHHHLTMLHNGGYINKRRIDRRMVYYLTDLGRRMVSSIKDFYEENNV